jgi:hypothetical protein
MTVTIRENATPIEILLVEDSPGDARLTQEAMRDAKVQNNLHIASDGWKRHPSCGGGGSTPMRLARILSCWI